MTLSQSIKRNYHAGFRDMRITDKKYARDIQVALWYPTYSEEQSLYYLEDYHGSVAENADYLNYAFPLVVSSHGSGGHRFNQHYIGEALARQGYYFAAIQHPYNNYLNNDDENDIANCWHRPRDMRVMMDFLQNEIPLNLIDKKGVVVIGHSYGGYTALALAGGKPDKSILENMFSNRRQVTYDFSQLCDRRVSGMVLLAPALANAFNHAALKTINHPTLLAVSGQDEIIQGADKLYLDMLPHRPTYIEYKNVGHYIFLMSCPAHLKDKIPIIAQDCEYKREAVHQNLIKKIITYLKQEIF